MPEYVRLVNKSDKPFDFHQNNKKRVIAPRGDTIVPFHVATTLFGDPGIRDEAPRNERTNQYNKVRSYFGYCLGMMSDDEWEARRPQIEVWDLETDSRVFMIFDDPTGELGSGISLTSTPQEDQIAALTATLARQQQLLEALLAERASTAPTPAASTTEALITPSTDTQITQSDGEDDLSEGDDQGDSPAGGSLTIDRPLAGATQDSPQSVPVGPSLAANVSSDDKPKLAPKEPAKTAAKSSKK